MGDTFDLALLTWSFVHCSMSGPDCDQSFSVLGGQKLRPAPALPPRGWSTVAGWDPGDLRWAGRARLSLLLASSPTPAVFFLQALPGLCCSGLFSASCGTDWTCRSAPHCALQEGYPHAQGREQEPSRRVNKGVGAGWERAMVRAELSGWAAGWLCATSGWNREPGQSQEA